MAGCPLKHVRGRRPALPPGAAALWLTQAASAATTPSAGVSSAAAPPGRTLMACSRRGRLSGALCGSAGACRPTLGLVLEAKDCPGSTEHCHWHSLQRMSGWSQWQYRFAECPSPGSTHAAARRPVRDQRSHAHPLLHPWPGWRLRAERAGPSGAALGALVGGLVTGFPCLAASYPLLPSAPTSRQAAAWDAAGPRSAAASAPTPPAAASAARPAGPAARRASAAHASAAASWPAVARCATRSAGAPRRTASHAASCSSRPQRSPERAAPDSAEVHKRLRWSTAATAMLYEFLNAKTEQLLAPGWPRALPVCGGWLPAQRLAHSPGPQLAVGLLAAQTRTAPPPSAVLPFGWAARRGSKELLFS